MLSLFQNLFWSQPKTTKPKKLNFFQQNFPLEITLQIFSFLDLKDLYFLGLVDSYCFEFIFLKSLRSTINFPVSFSEFLIKNEALTYAKPGIFHSIVQYDINYQDFYKQEEVEDYNVTNNNDTIMVEREANNESKKEAAVDTKENNAIIYMNAFKKQYIQDNLWKPFVLRFFENVDPDINVKNWLHMLRRRLKYIKRETYESELRNKRYFRNQSSIQRDKNKMKPITEKWFIENCTTVYECPLQYDNLEYRGMRYSRYCTVCEREVFSVRNREEFAEHVKAGDCVSFTFEGGRRNMGCFIL
ncbi:hypothetical protein ABK040_011497 [Willaertia magna]